MNIEKEIKEILIDKKDINAVLEDLREEKNLFEMKVHLIKVMNLCESIKKLSSLDMLIGNYMNISFDYDYDVGNILSIRYSSEIYRKSGSVEEEVLKSINEKTYELRSFHDDFLREDFNEGMVMKFKIEPNLDEKIMDLLLSKQIKTALNHVKMDLSLDKKENNKPGFKNKL